MSFGISCGGIFDPCVLYLVIFFGDIRVQGMWNRTLLVPRPTSVLLTSAEGGGAVGQAIAFVLSVGANMACFTPKVAATLVLSLYIANWIFILAVGKEHFLAMRTTTPEPHLFIDSHGPPYPYLLLMTS
jgi:hypothetical protein